MISEAPAGRFLEVLKSPRGVGQASMVQTLEGHFSCGGFQHTAWAERPSRPCFRAVGLVLLPRTSSPGVRSPCCCSAMPRGRTWGLLSPPRKGPVALCLINAYTRALSKQRDFPQKVSLKKTQTNLKTIPSTVSPFRLVRWTGVHLSLKK